MSALALALALFAQPAADPAPAAPPPAAEAPPPQASPGDDLPRGAPRDDYQFVAWCYGALRAYLDLHDEVMPEVTRIESTYRPPNRKLADDLKVYADMQKDGRRQLKLYQAAMTAAEKASLKPINVAGGQAVQQGRSLWTPAPEVTKARLAQEWMSWTLPARCEVTATTLEARAKLMGASFKVNSEPEATEAAPPAADSPATASESPAAPAPASEAPAAETSPPPEPKH